MDSVIGAGRKHRMQHEADRSRIEIEEPFGKSGRWMVDLEAARSGETVQVRIIGHLVVAFTPEEARDFAQALNRVAGA